MTGLLLACYPHLTLMFCGLNKNICLKESEVWRKVISKKIIVMLVIRGLLSSFLSCPAASVHHEQGGKKMVLGSGKNNKDVMRMPPSSMGKRGKQNVRP